jgi:hypothetical protein
VSDEFPRLDMSLPRAEFSSEYVENAAGLWEAWKDALPRSHRWVRHSAESLTASTRDLHGDAFAAAFTRSVFEDVSAYVHMHAWKLEELLRGAVVNYNSSSLVVASACARSAIESTVALTTVSYRANAALRHRGDPQATVQALGELSDFIDTSIWGGRSEGREVEIVNVLTLQQKLIKLTTDPGTKIQLSSVYAELCDIVHPSATGHQMHWDEPVAESSDGPWLVPLNRDMTGAMAPVVRTWIAWGVGWASAWGLRAFSNTRDQAEGISRLSAEFGS